MLLQIVYNHEPVSTRVTFLLYLTTGKNSSGDLKEVNEFKIEVNDFKILMNKHTNIHTP